MSDSTVSKMITLKSNDGKEFVVPKTAAKQSETICHIIEDTSTAMNPITLHNVTAPILEMVIEYCRKHVDDDAASSVISDGELKNWDMQFLDVDQETLFSLITAADYLNIKGLLDATCKKVADMMQGKSPEEIRKIFNIKNDYTPEQEDEVRRENRWAFDS